MGRSGDELKDSCVFICCKTDNQVADVAQRGIEVKASSASSLGKCCLYTWCSVQSLKYAVTAYAKKFAFHIKIISLLHCSRPAKTLNSTLVGFSWHFFLPDETLTYNSVGVTTLYFNFCTLAPPGEYDGFTFVAAVM